MVTIAEYSKATLPLTAKPMLFRNAGRLRSYRDKIMVTTLAPADESAVIAKAREYQKKISASLKNTGE